MRRCLTPAASAVWCLLPIACIVKSEPEQATAPAEQTAGGDEKPAAPVPPTPLAGDNPEKTWATVGQSAQIEHIRVSLNRAAIERVPLKDRIGNRSSKSDGEYVHLKVRVENLSDARKVNYTSWATEFSFGSDLGSLLDEYGNRYKRVGFGLGTDPVDRATSESIYPGKDTTDVLVFELPIEKATRLSLELPGGNCGVRGTFRFQLDTHGLVLAGFGIEGGPPKKIEGPARFKANEGVVLGGFDRRVWLGDSVQLGDAANEVERKIGTVSADRLAEKAGGLRWAKDGEVGVVIESGSSYTRVKIGGADEEVRVGVVPNTLLSPIPADKLPESKSKEAAPAPPRPDPKKEASKPVAPKEPPAPVDLDAAEKTHYALLAGERARVEAAAVAKFGRKPKEDDLAGFTVPYRIFIDAEMKKVFDAFEKRTGFSQLTAERILHEGDAKGWPKKK